MCTTITIARGVDLPDALAVLLVDTMMGGTSERYLHRNRTYDLTRKHMVPPASKL
jgi:hypothetical protein